MPKVMATPPNTGGILCKSLVPPFLVPHCKVWLTPTAWVPCSNAASIGEHKTWMQSEFCTWQNSVQSPRKCIYSVQAQETAKHRAKFSWPPLSDVGAVMTARCETCWNLLGCPKLTSRSQPLVGWSSPYCPYVPSLQRYSPTKLCDGVQIAKFWRFFVLYFQRAACSTFQTCILHSH